MEAMRLTASQRSAYYGQPGYVDKVTVSTPWATRCTVHVKISDIFIDACRAAARETTWRPQRTEGYIARKIAGTDTWSNHSWGLAVDFFATAPGVPPPGGVWDPDDRMPASFAKAFTDRGFTWGATFARRADYPHIEWAGPPPDKNAVNPTFEPQEEDMTPEQAAWLGRIHHETVAEGARLDRLEDVAAKALYVSVTNQNDLKAIKAKLGIV